MFATSASDHEVLAASAAEGLVFITSDRGDFGRELALTRALTPSVVLLRQLPNIVRAADVAALLLANLTDIVTAALPSARRLRRHTRWSGGCAREHPQDQSPVKSPLIFVIPP
jgi:predicted nuclease of predicted toxin-antitoxin system